MFALDSLTVFWAFEKIYRNLLIIEHQGDTAPTMRQEQGLERKDSDIWTNRGKNFFWMEYQQHLCQFEFAPQSEDEEKGVFFDLMMEDV